VVFPTPEWAPATTSLGPSIGICLSILARLGARPGKARGPKAGLASLEDGEARRLLARTASSSAAPWHDVVMSMTEMVEAYTESLLKQLLGVDKLAADQDGDGFGGRTAFADEKASDDKEPAGLPGQYR